MKYCSQDNSETHCANERESAYRGDANVGKEAEVQKTNGSFDERGDEGIDDVRDVAKLESEILIFLTLGTVREWALCCTFAAGNASSFDKSHLCLPVPYFTPSPATATFKMAVIIAAMMV